MTDPDISPQTTPPPADVAPAPNEPETPEAAPAAALPPAPRGAARRRNPWPYLFAFVLSVLVLGIGYAWVALRVAPLVPAAALDPAVVARQGRAIAALASQLDALGNRVQALENAEKTSNAPAALAPLAARLDGLAARLARLEAAPQQDSAAAGLAARLAQDEARLEALTQHSGAVAEQLAALSGRAQLLARLHEAELDLAAGRPLGELPGAPAALARFATTPPPTEAALRHDFPAAAAAARAALAPSLGTRLGDFLGALLTIRRGDQVLLGDPLAAHLARAEAALDAGDLDGALAALAPIEGPAAAALAPWKTQAAALVAARQALAALARAS